MDIVTLKIELECEPDSLHSPVIREIFRNALAHIITLEAESDGRRRVLFEKAEELSFEWRRAERAEIEREGWKTRYENCCEDHSTLMTERNKLTDQITKWHFWAETNGVFIPDYLKTDELKAALAANKEE